MPPAASAPSALATVTQIVADKTGYPTDMLAPDMDLESELGVDSIKQVEILSTLRERLPSLPEIAPERLGDLRTIAQIAAFIGGPAVSASAPAPPPAVIPAPAARVAPAPAAAPASSGDLAALVRTLIADKTGYPEDMLEDDMDLESELGVDSIKQVEILSALREARTDLPDIDPSQVAELRSIRKIADFFA